MKSKAKLKIIMLIALGILLAIAPTISVNPSLITGSNNVINLDNENLKISAVSGKIHIINNSGWVDFRNAGNCTGSGTYSDPYVIEDLVIDGGGRGSCIYILNSDVYFQIINCTLFNSGGWSPWYQHAGIFLGNITNSVIKGNDCSFNYFGILLGYSSNNNTISGNTANNNGGPGIRITHSNYNTISGNTANNNGGVGIGLEYSNNNTISGNIAKYNNLHGIVLFKCNNIIVSGNTANNNGRGGISLLESSNNNIISGNTANNNLFGILLEDSYNNTISGNLLIGNQFCIIEEYCEGNVIRDNVCTPSFNYVPISLIISITIVGVSVYIISLNRKRFRKPQEDVDFL